jgi:hypothetical protein
MLALCMQSGKDSSQRGARQNVFWYIILSLHHGAGTGNIVLGSGLQRVNLKIIERYRAAATTPGAQ